MARPTCITYDKADRTAGGHTETRLIDITWQRGVETIWVVGVVTPEERTCYTSEVNTTPGSDLWAALQTEVTAVRAAGEAWTND